jgi:hypothetical protein
VVTWVLLYQLVLEGTEELKGLSDCQQSHWEKKKGSQMGHAKKQKPSMF